MPTGFTYSTFSSTLAAMMVIDTSNDADWTTFLPSIIDGAELRIHRELDPIAARKNETTTFTASSPASLNGRLPVPTDLVVMREFGFYTPVGTTADTAGSWNQLQQMSDEWCREYWPARNTTGTPAYFALMDNSQMLIVPTPDAAYGVEMFLTARLPTLSAITTTSWIASNVPDLFLYAAAVIASGYLKNYGALADDPQAPVTWEKLYQLHLRTAAQEEARRKGEAYSDESASHLPRPTPTN